ncbi:hypothetical protein [Dictyobacter kobayashii]|uniref:hypothetical protein n=1 Tax=Dictyobacter kobayashii TaxID=2014872 RepID=UPI000F83BF3D|nr:hypothetical protein [Dictyobacter kobayashii]
MPATKVALKLPALQVNTSQQHPQEKHNYRYPDYANFFHCAPPFIMETLSAAMVFGVGFQVTRDYHSSIERRAQKAAELSMMPATGAIAITFPISAIASARGSAQNS